MVKKFGNLREKKKLINSQKQTSVIITKVSVIFNNTKGKFHIKACCKNNKKDVVIIESGSKVAIECTGEPDFLLNKISGPELL